MTFRIRKIVKPDLEKIFSGRRRTVLQEHIGDMDAWLRLCPRLGGAVDDQRCAFLLSLPYDREKSSWRYMFAVDDELVLLEKSGYQIFKVEYHTLSSDVDMTRAEQMIREGFAVGGLFLLENSPDVNKVPNATVHWGSRTI